MSERELPARPNIEYLKKDARALLQQAQAADASATARFAACGVTAEQAKLADALHVIAREYGFATWPELKLHIEVSAEDPLEALSAAIKSGDAAAVREVLARYTDWKAHINMPLPNFDFDMPAVVAAAYRNSPEMVDALLAAGADINQRSLWWAGGFGVLDFAKPELAQQLIARGAYVDIHAAARLGMIERVRELLSGDASLVHARGGDGQLPLHFAATVEIAELLLEHGAEIDARDIDHESTAAQYLVSRGAEGHDVVRFLISRGAETDIMMASALGDLALVERILNDDPDTVRATVSERSFPKRDPKSGGCIYIYTFGITKTPHVIAQQFGHAAVFALLMQRSAPWLRLVQAAELGDETMMEQILRQHPALFAKLTPNAARRIVGPAVRNNGRAVELLLARGWPAGPVLDNGQTALHYAAFHGNATAVRALLAKQAPVNVSEAEHGSTPLGWALYGSLHGWARDAGDYPAVVRMLLDAGAELPKSEEPLRATEEVLEVLGSVQ